MPVKQYHIYINATTRIFVYFLNDGKNIIDFVVKIEYFLNNRWLEMERYDCAHGMVHKDILDRSGNKKRVIPYPLADNTSGLNYAISDFKENHLFISLRFFNE